MVDVLFLILPARSLDVHPSVGGGNRRAVPAGERLFVADITARALPYAAGPTQGHFGIQGMQERIGSLGGTLAIESEPARGTAVSVHLSGVDAAP